MALSCIVSDIKQGKKNRNFSYKPHLHLNPPPVKVGRRTMVVIFVIKVALQVLKVQLDGREPGSFPHPLRGVNIPNFRTTLHILIPPNISQGGC